MRGPSGPDRNQHAHLQGKPGRLQTNGGKARLNKHLAEPLHGPGLSLTHRKEIKTKVGITHRLGTRSPRHGFGHEQTSATGQGAVNGTQNGEGPVIIVVIQHADQGGDIGTRREGGLEKLPP